MKKCLQCDVIGSERASVPFATGLVFSYGSLSFSRYVLVKFADRGLVSGGYPNLGLAETLSFVTYGFFVACIYGIFPLSHQIRNNFPANSRKGQLCMQLDFVANENYTKHRIKQAIFPFLVMVFICMMRRNMRRSVKEQNLRMSTLAQYGGKHHRNIFTAPQNFSYVLVCIVFAFAENGFMIILQQYPGFINKRTQSAVHNLLFLFIADFFLGFCLPIKHMMTSRERMPELWLEKRSTKVSEFHVRKPCIVPRRDFTPQRFGRKKPGKKSLSLLPSIREESGQCRSTKSTNMTSLVDNFKERVCKETPVSE